MSRLRRYHRKGNIYFITSVTYYRHPLLIRNIDLLKRSIEHTIERVTFDIFAWVIMPDHFHAIIDPKNNDISNIIQRIKMSFGALLREQLGKTFGRAWQHRFWDHIIRDQNDMNRHFDYIHYNPVKHGYVNRPYDWQHSSIHEYSDVYPVDWGIRERIEPEGEFGE